MNNNKVTFLVSFTIEDNDPRTILAQELLKINHPNILEVEVVDDNVFDFDDIDADEYDFFDMLNVGDADDTDS